MVKRLSGIMLTFVMLVMCITPIVSAAEIAEIKSSGTNFVHATSYQSTSIGSSHHFSDYQLYAGGILHQGAAAFVGKKYAEYMLKVDKHGMYNFTVIGDAIKDTDLELSVGGVVVSTAETSGRTNYLWDMGDVELPAGLVSVRLSSTNSTSTMHYFGFNVTWSSDVSQVDFSRKDGAYKEHTLPTSIRGEHFDLGSNGHISLDGKNSLSKIRKNDEMDIETLEGTGNVLVLSSGEMAAYTFNVETAGNYDFYISASANAKFIIEFDGYARKIDTQLKNIAFSDTLVDTLYLEKGQYRMKLYASDESVKVDRFRFGLTTKVGATLNDVIVKEDDSSKPASIYKTLYVDQNGSDENDGSESTPFKTVNRAIEEVGRINSDMTGDIIISISSGTHQLDEKLYLTAATSGKNGYKVIFRGEDENERSEISGGVKVTGWEKYDDQIYVAPVEGVDDVRNLYVNTYPADKAESKYQYRIDSIYSDPFREEGSQNGFLVPKRNTIDFEHPEDLELCLQWDWLYTRVIIETIEDAGDGMNNIFWVKAPSRDAWASLGTRQTLFTYENAMELLDEPGEFYYDTREKKIYYYPLGNEDMSTAETYVAKTEQFMQIKGETENKAGNFDFENIRFIYGACNALTEYGSPGNQNDGLVDDVSSPYTGLLRDDGFFGINTGHFRLDHVDNVNIKNCEFIGMGSTTLVMNDEVSNVNVVGNIFRDSSGAAIRMGGTHHSAYQEKYILDGHGNNVNIKIDNNVISRVGGEMQNNCAISEYYDKNITITHNIINDVPYSGINAGWGYETNNGYDTANFEIAYNYVYNAMAVLEDGGSLYTLGKVPGSLVHDNYFDKSGRTGYYNDAGSRNFTTWNNVVTNCKTCYFIQSTAYNTGDIKLYNNYADIDGYSHNGRDLDVERNISVENPILLEHGEEWPEEAYSIMAASGVVDEYSSLVEEAAIPDWHPLRTTTPMAEEFVSAKAKDVNRLRGYYYAKDYMEGGEGVAYHKISYGGPNNNEYRPEDVGLEFDNSKNDWMVSLNTGGEWINYEIDVPRDGTYTIEMETKQLWWDFPAAKMYLDGEILNDAIMLEKSPQGDWCTNPVSKVFLSAGKHVLKMEFITYFYFYKINVYDSRTADDAKDPNLYTNDENWDEIGRVIGTGHREAEPEPDYTVPFTDISDHWAGLVIRRLYRKGMLNGKSETIFAPNDNVKVSEAILMIGRGYKIDDLRNEDTWYSKAIEKGIISSDMDVNRPITREELATIMMKTYLTYLKEYNIKIQRADAFNDISEVSIENQNYVIAAKQFGYMTGDENGNFNPSSDLTRAEAAAILSRIAG